MFQSRPHVPGPSPVRKSRRSKTIRAAIEPLETRRLLAQSVWAFPGADGMMLYKPLPLGDRIGDFTNVGYRAGLAPIPDIPVKATVSPVDGDDRATIQAAIDAVEAMPLDASGFRGAVLLNPGTYEIATSLLINTSGVVLRGSGQGQTILVATGTEKDSLVRLAGNTGRTNVTSSTQTITDKYVPVGAISFTVANASGFAVGDKVIVHRPTTANWLHDIGMDQLDNPWTGRDVNMDRTITRIDGNVITVDAPMTHALDARYTDATNKNTIYKYTHNSARIENVGVEYITGRSTFDPTIRSGSDYVDENHAENFITVDGVSHGWVRNVTSEYFGYACVVVKGNSKWVTVTDSQCLDPVSVVTGGRRYSFLNDDAFNVLFKNLYTRSGRHDFVQGSDVAGPNVFLDSRADSARSDTGPHHRYATGTLWDNIDVNGHSINIQNRWNSGSGHGWAGANQVVWNSEANSFTIQNIGFPASAWNWAIGNIGTQNTGDFIAPDNTQVGSQGLYDSHGTKVDTRSLYYAQMAERWAYDGLVYREMRVGDGDGFTAGDLADAVAVDAAWRTGIQNATGRTGVGFDSVSGNQLVPFTFNFTLDPGTYVVGASLRLGLKSAGGSTASDRIYFEHAGRSYTWQELGLPSAGPTATADGFVIDLSWLLPALQDGRLNVAINGNTAVDWATLDFKTAGTALAIDTSFRAVADAYVDQNSPAANFGAATTLQTKLNGATDNKESYLRFDLTALPAGAAVTRAYLRLTPTSVGVAAAAFGSGTGAIFNRVSFVGDDAWSETGINWNNRPSSDPFFREFIAYVNEPVYVDMTALVRGALAGDKLLSLRLNSLVNSSAGQISFASDEHGTAASRPQLVVTSYNTTLSPVADAYVRDGTPTTNYGTEDTLQTKNSTGGTTREAYLKFDLSSLTTPLPAAQVRLVPVAPDTVTSTATNSMAVATNNGWTETGLVWGNKPGSGAALMTWRPQYLTPVVVPVTSAAGAALAGDKLLSVRVYSNTSSSGITSYGSRENADASVRPLLTVTNLRPMITTIPDIDGTANTPVGGVWFGVWDAETLASALAISATSTNTALLPKANITFGGSGTDRTFTLTPAPGQSGTTDVTITVTDAQGLTRTATFTYNVTGGGPLVVLGDQDAPGQADVIRIVRSGTFLDVYRNNATVPVIHTDYASLGAVWVQALGGNDSVTLDYTGGNPVPAGGLTVDGGDGADTLWVIGAAGAETVTLTAGNVTIGGSTAAGYLAVETLALTLGAGGDSLVVAGNGAVSAGAMTLGVVGTVTMGPSSSLPTFTDVTVGGTLVLNGQSQTIDELWGGGTVANNASATTATLTVGQHNGSSTFSGGLTNGAGTLALTKVGTGALTLNGYNSYTGATAVNGGVLLLNADFSTTSPLTIADGVVRLGAGQNRMLRVAAVSLTGTGQLDVADGSVLIDYAVSTPAALVRAFLYNGQITSSVAAVTPNRSVGYAEAALLGLGTFGGPPVDATALLLKYAVTGDANLDGVISADDHALTDRGRAMGLGAWVFGDFNYDGQVTDADYAMQNQSAGTPAPDASDIALPITAPVEARASKRLEVKSKVVARNGRSATVAVQVSNRRKSGADGFAKLRIYLSRDGVVGADDTLLLKRTVPIKLKGKGTALFNFRVAIPGAAARGLRVIAIAE